MSADIFSGLGGLVKGLSGFVPQDDPDFRLMSAQTEASEQRTRLTDLYAQIGKLAVEKYGLESFDGYADKLKLTQSNLADAEASLNAAHQEKEARELAEKEKEEKETCPECGFRNPEGVKFCQECGTKLGIRSKNLCKKCGAELSFGIRFCGECGSKQPEA